MSDDYAQPEPAYQQPSFRGTHRKEITVSSGPKDQPRRSDGETSSEPVEWQGSGGGEDSPRESRNVETETQQPPERPV
jgi:hypothetical protein